MDYVLKIMKVPEGERHISICIVLENHSEEKSKKAIVGLARKLLVIIYTMQKQGAYLMNPILVPAAKNMSRSDFPDTSENWNSTATT